MEFVIIGVMKIKLCKNAAPERVGSIIQYKKWWKLRGSVNEKHTYLHVTDLNESFNFIYSN